MKLKRLKKLISMALILPIFAVAIPSRASRSLTESDVMAMAEEIGAEYCICPELLTAIAFKESSFDPYAEHEGCVGLMQVSPKWHVDRMKRLGVADLREPYENMLVAADYLLELFKEYKDLGMVLQIYNGDTNAWEYWEGNPEMSEYARDIMRMSKELERKYENKGEKNYVR